MGILKTLVEAAVSGNWPAAFILVAGMICVTTVFVIFIRAVY